MSYNINDFERALENLDNASDYFNGAGDGVDEEIARRFFAAILQAEEAVEDAMSETTEQVREQIAEDLGAAVGAARSDFYLPNWVDDNTFDITHVGSGATVTVTFEVEEN